MSSKISHWKKQVSIKNQKAIFDIISNSGPIRENDLLARLAKLGNAISQPTLIKHLTKMEEKDEIERYYDKKKKANFFRVHSKEEKTITGTARKYESMEFIEGIKNPLFAHEERGGNAISAFTNRTGNKLVDDLAQKALNSQVKAYLRFIRAPKVGRKIAVVIMTGIEKQREKEKEEQK